MNKTFIFRLVFLCFGVIAFSSCSDKLCYKCTRLSNAEIPKTLEEDFCLPKDLSKKKVAHLKDSGYKCEKYNEKGDWDESKKSN